MTITKRYTLIGSPTDTNGVITNTSSSNYIQTLTGLSSDYDIVLKIKFNTTNQDIAIFSLSTANSNVCIYSDSSGKICWWNGFSSESTNSDYQYQTANNWVFVRLYYNNETPMFAVKQSTVQETLTEALVGNWDTKYAYMYGVDPNEKWNIGYTPYNGWNLSGATVDLTNSSINGELFYEDVQPQPSSSLIKIGSSDISKLYFGNNELSKLYLGTNLIYGGSTPPTPSDPWYEWDVTGTGAYMLSRNGLYKNFNNTQGLLTNEAPSSTVTSLEMSFTFKTGSTVNGYYCLAANNTSNKDCPELCVYYDKFEIDLPSDSSTWGTIIVTNDVNISANTNYRLDFEWSSGNNIVATLTNLDTSHVHPFTLSSGTMSPASIYWANPIRIAGDQDGGSVWNGEIDLSKSYIKVNGDYICCTRHTDPQPDYWWNKFDWPSAMVDYSSQFHHDYSYYTCDVPIERLYKLVFNNAAMSSSWGIVEAGGGRCWHSLWWDSNWVPVIDKSPFSDTQVTSFGSINPVSDIVYYKYTFDPSDNNTITFSVSRDKTNWYSVTGTRTTTTDGVYDDLSFMWRNPSLGSYPTSGCYIDTTESYIKVDGVYMVPPYTSS